MNRKLLITLGILVVVVVALFFIKGKPGDQGIDISDRQFKIENTKDIEMLSIERKDYPTIIFTKKGNKWVLNNGNDARIESINHLFSILGNLKIKYIPNQLQSDNIINSIKKSGIKVRAYNGGNDLMKSFFIGPDLGDGTGTAFLMEGAKQPFVMFTPNFYGSIRTRFVFDLNEYETKKILGDLNNDNIEEIEIKYPYDKPSSFKLTKGTLGYTLINPYTQVEIPALNEKVIEPYLQNLNDISAEYNDANNSNRDMIVNQPKFCEITIKLKDGSIQKADVFSLANIEFHEQRFSPKEVTPDTRFIVHNNNNQFFLIQYRVLNKMLVAYDSFAKR